MPLFEARPIPLTRLSDAAYSPVTHVIRRAVDFNAANTDFTIPVVFPAGYTRYFVQSIRISAPSAAISLATCGIFTGAGATGVTVMASGSTTALSSIAENTSGNAQSFGSVGSGVTTFNATSLYFRVQTAQGSAVTADVALQVAFFP